VTTVNLLNPFWGGRTSYRYWRWVPLGNKAASPTRLGELVFAETVGGPNLLNTGNTTAPQLTEIQRDFLYDGDTTTSPTTFDDQIDANTLYVQADLGVATTVAQVRMSAPSASTNLVPVVVAMAASDDGTTWTAMGIYDLGAAFAADETRSFLVEPTPAPSSGRAGAHAWAIYQPDGSNSWRLAELQYSVGAGGTNLATGGFAAAWGTNTDGPEKAFDSNNSTFWRTVSNAEASITYVFPTAPNPTHYRITGSTSTDHAPTSWELYYLENNATWVLADTQTGQTGWTSNETREFAIP
jgi:hypothetical protein